MEMGCQVPLSPRPLESQTDTGRTLDYITVFLILPFATVFVLGNLVMVYFRDYRPIKSKSVQLTVLSSLGGLIWLGATIVVNDHFGRRQHTIWTICPLWTFWLQGCFGFALWLNCFICRLLNLHSILIFKRGAMKHPTAVLLLLLLPIIIFAIVASAFGASRFTFPVAPPPAPENGREQYHHHHHRYRQGDCTLKKWWSVWLIVILPVYFLVFILLAIGLRNVRPQYNEFRLIRNGGIISLFLFLLSLVTFQTKVYLEVTGRCFLTLAVSGAVFYYFWARNWEVLYNVLFNKEEYLKAFLAKMNAIPASGQLSIVSHRHPLEDCLLDTRSEVSSLQDEVDRLEREMMICQEQLQKEWRWDVR